MKVRGIFKCLCVHPKAEIPQSSVRCIHSSITLTECLSRLLWVTTLKDLQRKKANKQADVLPGNCRLFLWHWPCRVGFTSASHLHSWSPAEREHGRTHNTVTGIWSTLLCSRPVTSSAVNPRFLIHICLSVVTGCTATVHSRLFSELTACHGNRRLLRVFCMFYGVQTARESRFNVEKRRKSETDN